MAKRFNDTKKRDPYRNFNFKIELGAGVVVAACKKMSGLTASVEAVKFRAGDDPSTVDQVMPGRVSYEPVTLEAGVTDNEDFKKWANALIANLADTGRTPDPSFRRDVIINVYDVENDKNNPAKKFTLHNAWVSKFTALSDLAADANDVLIETIEIQHEGFTEERTTRTRV